MQHQTALLGIMLCGGKSTRMGRDKGLIPFKDKTWASLGAEKLSALGMPVVYSIHAEQTSPYSLLIADAVMVTDDESLPVKGPLLGLLSVHRTFPGSDLFLLACDLPFIEASILRELRNTQQHHPGYDAYLFGTSENPEPVCAIYMASALESIKLGEGTNNSLRYWLHQWKVYTIPIPSEKEHCFQNMNTPEDGET
jgi:molybdopterin-guanine dinucleotide biosynthesis protein A